MTNNYHGDQISDLQYDSNEIDDYTNSENEPIVTAIFEDPEQVRTFVNEFQDTIFAAIIFVLLSLKSVDEIIMKIGLGKSYISILLIKSILFAIVFYIVQRKFNFHKTTS